MWPFKSPAERIARRLERTLIALERAADANDQVAAARLRDDTLALLREMGGPKGWSERRLLHYLRGRPRVRHMLDEEYGRAFDAGAQRTGGAAAGPT
jgi:hypothetical protein